ncbi:MAG: ABC transporter substrate-binding protein [Actinomycetota bacterium]
MTLNVKRSRRVRQIAIGLGLALAVSTVGVSGSSAAKVQADTPKPGGDITVGIFDLMLTNCYSPNLSNSALGAIKSVYEGLLEKKSDGTVVPYLLEAFSSTDNITWTFKLRSGIKFHNGEDLNTAAVLLNLNALMGRLAGVYGLHTLGSGVPFTANMASVTAIDNLSFSIKLWRAQPDFPDSLYASGRFYMRAPAQIKTAAACKAAPIGTGPFKFVSGTETEFKVTKNESYWRKDAAGNALPYLNSITFKYVSEPSQRANGIRSGKLDAAQFTSASEVQQIVSLQADKKVQMIASPDEYYPNIFLNQAIEPFNNEHARLAFAYAYDVNTFYKARNCVKGKCIGTIPTSIVGKANVMYNTKGFKKYSLANAKTELALYKAATGKDLAFTLPVGETTASMANAKAIQQIMAKAGITVTLNQETGSAIVAKAFPSPGSSPGNPYQVLPILLFEGQGTSFTIPFLVSNTANDVGNFSGKGPLAGLAAFYPLLSLTRHKNASVDKALFDARADGSAAALKGATEVVQNSGLVVPTPTLVYFYGLNPKLKGFDTYTLASGGKGKPMTNAGINWTGVYVSK